MSLFKQILFKNNLRPKFILKSVPCKTFVILTHSFNNVNLRLNIFDKFD